MSALIEMLLSESTRIQLEHSSEGSWTQGYERKMVTDLLNVTAIDGHIVVNPNSDPTKAIEVSGAFDGKSVIYAAFKFALDEFAAFYPGRHETAISYQNQPRTRKAVSFRTDEHGRWHCFRVQNKGLVEIKFRELSPGSDPYDVYLRDNYQNVHDMIDLVMMGAYCDVDLTGAPQLQAYFLGLLAMSPEDAKITINQHENNKIASNESWRKSRGVLALETYPINGASMAAQAVEQLGRIKATKGETAFTTNANNLGYLAELVKEGYTLSSQS